VAVIHAITGMPGDNKTAPHCPRRCWLTQRKRLFVELDRLRGNDQPGPGLTGDVAPGPIREKTDDSGLPR
jgi:hypothetical protein